MTARHRFELASEARANVARVLALLERPDVGALDNSTVELARAVALVEQLRKEGPGGGASLKSALNGLRSDLRHVRSLLRHAWEFRVGSGGQSGYNINGELTSQQQPAARFALEA
jgi:hypothetical protein